MNIKGLYAALTASACAFQAAADNREAVFVPGLDEVPVAEGVTNSVTGRISIDPSTKLFKTGNGTLKIDTSSLDGPDKANIVVKEGTLLRTDSSAVADPVLSDAVKAKLAVWLSVKDPDTSHLTTRTIDGDETAYVERWYDVRETDTSSPRYIYAETTHLATDKGPVRQTGRFIRQYSTVTNTMEGLYFGGLGSGISMDFKLPDGNAFATGPKEMSAVHGIINSWGYLFGDARTGSGNPHMEGDNGARSISQGYIWDRCWGPQMGDARIWVDGVRHDSAKPVKRGFQLLHRTLNTIAAGNFNSIQALYSWSSNSSATSDTWRKGGDYVGEVMYFTNILTAAERRDVQNYLMRKWFGRSIPATDVEVAGGGTVEFDAADGGTFVSDTTVSGSGVFIKKGAGTLVHRPSSGRADNLAGVVIEEGDVLAPRILPVKLSDGDLVTAQQTDGNVSTVRVTRAAGTYGDNRIVKTGNSTLTASSVPGTVRSLEVREGTLVLTPAATDSVRLEVSIPNSGFEIWDESDAEAGNVKTPNGGWSGNGYFYHYDRWTELGNGGPLSATIAQYGFQSQPPPEGSCALLIRATGNSVYRTVTIPEDGEYDFSFMFWGRATYAFGGYLSVSLRDTESDEEIVKFGSVNFTTDARWIQQNMRAFVKAGTYKLDLASCWGGPSKASFTELLIDDLHLYKTGDYKAAYKIPGGDFEEICGVGLGSNGITRNCPENMSTQYTVKGWSFSTNYYKSYPEVAVVNPRMIAENGLHKGSGYSGERRPYGGEYQLLFRHTGATASATFTPPEGRWYLKCHTGRWSQYNNPRLNAKVACGGVTNDLGEVKIDNLRTPQPNVWPTPFTADGENEVTLLLTYLDDDVQYRGINVDDFMLVAEYENERNLVENGNIESPWGVNGSAPSRDGWTHVAGRSFVDNAVEGTEYGGCVSREYGRDDLTAFGTDHGSGDYFLEIYYRGGLYQDVTLPHAGWYRLSFLLKGRRSSKESGCRDFIVELVDTDSAVTNGIMNVAVASKGVYEQQTCLFRVDEAGTYRLLFRGNYIWGYYCIDDISLKFAGTDGVGKADIPGEKTLAIDISDGARLRLDFSGTNTIRRFRAGGVGYREVIDGSVCPYVEGPGALYVPHSGSVIVFR